MKVLLLSLLIVTSFVTVSALTSGDFKTKYQMVTAGMAAPTESDLLSMYQDYTLAFKELAPGMNFGRYEVFTGTVKKIMEHNQDPSKTWKMGFNKFSDWTDAEFFEFYGLNLNEEQHCSATASPRKSYNSAIPDSYDWSDYNKVTPVKNQGSCGSCWTFSTIGAMEAHALLATESTPTAAFNFSEQQLVDCAQDYDNHGCSGGLPSHAFEYISQRGGLEHRNTYEYYAEDMECHHEAPKSVVTTSGSFNITAEDEDQLHEALYHEGPVSVSYQVRPGFKDYESGVYFNDDCGQTTMDVNHAVLAVGYGSEDGVEYYRIKNSWGADWGNHGHFKIRAYTNECAIGVCNSYPENVEMISSNPMNSVKEFLTSA